MYEALLDPTPTRVRKVTDNNPLTTRPGKQKTTPSVKATCFSSAAMRLK